MRAIGQYCGSLLVAVSLFAVPAAVRAQAVVNVLTVKVKGDQDAYLAKTKPFSAIIKRNGATSVRVFRAMLAGDRTGLISFVSEYPSLEAYGKSAAKNAADPELQKLRKELDASGIREIVSSSLSVEVTPPADAPK
jgi:hypothetical protein